MADDIIDIGDESSDDYKNDGDGKTSFNKEAVMRSRLRCDNRKWYLSKLAPKRYGNDRVIKHQQLDSDGQATDPIPTQINIHAQDIAASVHEEMKRVIDAESAAETTA